MNQTSLTYFSRNQQNLDSLLHIWDETFNDPEKFAFNKAEEFLNFLKDDAANQNVRLILLDLCGETQIEPDFLISICETAPSAVKLIFSENHVFSEIQNNSIQADSFYFINSAWESEDYKIVLKTVRENFNNFQILSNFRSDVSAYPKKLDEDLSRQMKELTESNIVKDKLYSIIAHDLKSPFNALLGISEILISDWHELTDREKLELVEGLKSTSENTYKLLENLLLWSKTHKEELVIKAMKVMAMPVINEVIAFEKGNIKRKNIKISTNIEKDICLCADKQMLLTVFRNLLSNAIKYIQINGKINISARREKNLCVFCIKDNGDGISQKHILNYFSKERDARCKVDIDKFKGLGLLLCKDFVTKNGGDIWLETQKGIGSKFYFTIPYSRK